MASLIKNSYNNEINDCIDDIPIPKEVKHTIPVTTTTTTTTTTADKLNQTINFYESIKADANVTYVDCEKSMMCEDSDISSSNSTRSLIEDLTNDLINKKK
jgi:hypothetical protein